MSNSGIKYLEKKYNKPAKIKAGRVYEQMDRANPSNSMGIVIVYNDGRYADLDTNLSVHPDLDYQQVSEVLFYYHGSNYLTVNRYRSYEVMAVSGMPTASPKLVDVEVKQPEASKLSRHRSVPKGGVIDSSPETKQDVDVPW